MFGATEYYKFQQALFITISLSGNTSKTRVMAVVSSSLSWLHRIKPSIITNEHKHKYTSCMCKD